MGRISYRKYPVLEILKNNSFNSLRLAPDEYKDFPLEAREQVKRQLLEASKLKNVTSVSSTFIKGAERSISKLITLLKEDYSSKEAILLIDERLVVYSNKQTPEGFVASLLILGKSGNIMLSGVAKMGPTGGFINMYATDFYIKGLDASMRASDKSQIFAVAACQTDMLLLFKKYAQVEIVESKARTKIHAHGCKYLNETDLDIEYLDSKWFTSLVNSQGFKVGGHFRLQPKKKEGEWTKELIWINDFEKKGYNRKAGILND